MNLYVKEKRTEDAEKELRTLAAADPSDLQSGLNVVRYLQQTKGPAAARAELVVRSNGSGDTFPYQIALAEFDATQGKTADAVERLETLIKASSSRPECHNGPDKVGTNPSRIEKIRRR